MAVKRKYESRCDVCGEPTNRTVWHGPDTEHDWMHLCRGCDRGTLWNRLKGWWSESFRDPVVRMGVILCLTFAWAFAMVGALGEFYQGRYVVAGLLTFVAAMASMSLYDVVRMEMNWR